MTSLRAEKGFTASETVVVLGLMSVLGAGAMPMMGNAISHFRLTGDARSVSNAVAVVKMRAASKFSRVRLHADLSANTHRVEMWDKTTSRWVREGGPTSLFSAVSFNTSSVATPPPDTQAVIGQAPACTDDAGDVIANTACVMFNSRGVPIDASGAPTAIDALYLTDGTAVYGVTIAATGMIRTWRTEALATPSWVLQ